MATRKTPSTAPRTAQPAARPSAKTARGSLRQTISRTIDQIADAASGGLSEAKKVVRQKADAARQQITSTAYSFRARAADTIAAGSDLTLNDSANYGLGWYGTGRTFASTAIDGPVLYGNAGGALGSYNGTTQATALRWNASGQVGIGTATLSGAAANTKLVLQGDDTGAPPLQLNIRGNTDTNKRLLIGYNTTSNYGSLQAYNGVSTATSLLLNPVGGNVGIGTTSTTARLDVAGAIKATGAGGYSFNTGDTDGGMFSPADGTLTFSTNGTERMRLDANGNVGIGLTNPVQKLDVNGAAQSHSLELRVNGSTPHIDFSSTTAGDYNARIIWQGGAPNRLDFEAPAYAFLTGNVGIGAVAPSQKLEVAGNAYMGSADNNALVVDSSGFARLGLVKKAGFDPVIAAGSSSHIVFAQSNQSNLFTNIGTSTLTEHMRIASGGNVGIATASPADRLHVKGNLRIERYDATNFYQFYVDSFNSLVFKYNSGANYSYLNATSSGLISTSDRRIKKDIAPMQDCLARIMKLTPSTFRYNTAAPGSPLNYGFIAQDVEQQFPDIVEEKEGLKRLASSAFEGINLRAIQELKQEKDAELKALKEENATLRERLAELEAASKDQDARLAAIEKALRATDKSAARTASIQR